MSKKHFIALANHIREWNKWHSDKRFSQDQIVTLACFLGNQNPRFNAQRWLDYIDGKCGPNGGTIKKAAA